MSNYSFAGNLDILRLPDGIKLGKDGRRTVMRWKGRYEDLLGLVPQVRGADNSNEVDLQPEDDGPFAVLSVTTGEVVDGEEAADEKILKITWNRSGNNLEKLLTTFKGMNTASAVALRAAIKKWEDPPGNTIPNYATIRAAISVSGDSVRTELARKLFDEYMQGAESYPVAQYVLRRTAILPANYKKQWATHNELKQMTVQQLKDWEGLPETLVFEIPSTGVWVKQPANIQQQNNGTWEIVNEWLHGDSASELFFPEATAPAA